MFGIGRKAIPLKIVAASIAQVALTFLEHPSEEDLELKCRAVSAGTDPDRFTLEAIALQVCIMTAAMNRERLEGRLKLETQQTLIMEFLRAVHKRLVENTTYDLLRLELDPDETFEVLTMRSERYSEPGWGRAAPEDIPRFFAECCGDADSPILKGIGWHLAFVRGDANGDWLRGIKIV